MKIEFSEQAPFEIMTNLSYYSTL